MLEWTHDEVRFAMEGKLLFTQPTDTNWRKRATIKLSPINAVLVTLGKVSHSNLIPNKNKVKAFCFPVILYLTNSLQGF